MIIFDFIAGLLLVFAGRNLFWLCVGIVGFLLGVQFTAALGISNGMMALLAAFALGCLGALLAVSFEWFAVVFGVGFLGGGYLIMQLFPAAVSQDQYSWLIFVVGGIVGMCLMIIIFDWALILISSLLGATLIMEVFYAVSWGQNLLFMATAVTGIVVQYVSLKGEVRQKSASRN